MGSSFKIKPKLRIGERFAKGLGSIFDYLSPSMQLPLLKFMKKLHPIYADRLIYDMTNSYFTRDSIYNKMGVKKNKAERELNKWIFANVDHAAGREDVKIGWPKLLDFTIREGNRKKPPNFISAFDENFLKYKETDEFKYDMALEDQKLQEELANNILSRERYEKALKEEKEKENAKIIPFKRPEKYRGGIISLIS